MALRVFSLRCSSNWLEVWLALVIFDPKNVLNKICPCRLDNCNRTFWKSDISFFRTWYNVTDLVTYNAGMLYAFQTSRRKVIKFDFNISKIYIQSCWSWLGSISLPRSCISAIFVSFSSFILPLLLLLLLLFYISYIHHQSLISLKRNNISFIYCWVNVRWLLLDNLVQLYVLSKCNYKRFAIFSISI
jgi:hypothetical protein